MSNIKSLMVAAAAALTLSVQAAVTGEVMCDLSSPLNDPQPVFPVPTANQLRWHDMEFYAFMHFGINTFTGREWGNGDEDINMFDPAQPIDVVQWVTELKGLGCRGIILTCKHHDGFCTWFTESTEHSTKNNTTQYGHVDLPRMLSEECARQGMKFGAYISPWDRNHAEYGRQGYVDAFRQQIREICSNYGPIFEMWFDGANGGSGYYGGANEKRQIDPEIYYDFPTTFKMIRELQPECAIWGWDQDCQWVGNEDGWTGETTWAIRDNTPENANHLRADYGDATGWRWLPGEVDARNGRGWFWTFTPDQLYSPEELFDIYLKSVGRGSNLILNFPPDKNGRLAPEAVEKMHGMRALMDKAFGRNLAEGATATASDERSSSEAGRFGAANVLDGDPATFWALEDGVTAGHLDITLPEATEVSYVQLSEPLAKGQRIKQFHVMTWNGSDWVPVNTRETLTTVGHKRIVPIEPVVTDRVRIVIDDSKVCPLINNVAIF